MKTTPVRAALQ